MSIVCVSETARLSWQIHSVFHTLAQRMASIQQYTLAKIPAGRELRKKYTYVPDVCSKHTLTYTNNLCCDRHICICCQIRRLADIRPNIGKIRLITSSAASSQNNPLTSHSTYVYNEASWAKSPIPKNKLVTQVPTKIQKSLPTVLPPPLQTKAPHLPICAISYRRAPHVISCKKTIVAST